jgi:demethylmenaquinone methyltransferase/2-methoxy-6-polyprenyl-1,4-benzoquinol methylase
LEASEKNNYRPLQKMFMSVPPRYDLLNRILTLRFDERWRKKATRQLLDNRPKRLLDLCTGTGDLALRLRKNAPVETEVYALDFSQPMLEIAREKAARRNISGVDFRFGDAADMPYEDGFFDGLGIAYAFRNLTYKNPDTHKFFAEILRVLRKGGQFVAVETSQPDNPLIRKLYHAQMRYITAPVGGLLTGEKEAYKYLAYSASDFYTPEEMKKILLTAGFAKVDYQQLLGGVAVLWTCTK